MIVVQVDSRFVNAAIYVVIDVFCFSLISFELRKLQTSLTKYRLRRGQHVELRESTLSFIAGGALADGTSLFSSLAVLHIILLSFLFVLTLGVSGSTIYVTRSASREYTTRLATNGPEDIARSRLNPKFFTGCAVREKASLKYYPTAFNIKGNLTITDFYSFTNENSAVAAVDINGMLCQKYGNMPPLMNVIRCGETDVQCSNLIVAEEVSVRVRKERGLKFETVGSGYGLLGAYMNVNTAAKHIWDTEYDRLICFELARRGNSASPLSALFNCVLGKWNMEKTVFMFRVGKGVLPYSPGVREDLQNTSLDTTFAFRASSEEIVLSWDLQKRGEWIFIQAATPFGKDFIDARSFLDSMMSRTIVAEKADGIQLLEEEPVPATEIEIFSLVGYIAVLGVSALLMIGQMGRVTILGRLLRIENICVDVTSFNGLLSIFQCSRKECFRNVSQRTVKFGIVRNEVEDVLAIRAVEDGDPNIPVSPRTRLDCCQSKEKRGVRERDRLS